MKLFKAIGEVLQATTEAFVTTASAVNTTARAVDNVAKMGEEASASMLNEQREEAKQSLALLKATKA